TQDVQVVLADRPVAGGADLPAAALVLDRNRTVRRGRGLVDGPQLGHRNERHVATALHPRAGRHQVRRAAVIRLVRRGIAVVERTVLAGHADFDQRVLVQVEAETGAEAHGVAASVAVTFDR